ncbi:MAG: hypothetical protein J0G96_11850 [Flavobacteriia bacterium]|nr:hypothetical protein [Flavobacteriia bacterium]
MAKFRNVIDKAQKSCEEAGEAVKNHFAAFSKMVEVGSVHKKHSDGVRTSGVTMKMESWKLRDDFENLQH